VLHFRRAECFGVKAASFLEFQRRFLGYSEVQATSDYKEMFGSSEWLDRV